MSVNALQNSLQNLVLISNHLPRYKELFDDCSENMLGYRRPATIIDLCLKGEQHNTWLLHSTLFSEREPSL